MSPERRSLKEVSIRQNVRVGDNLGIRITGEDARLDMRPEKRMAETAFFKDIYIRANDGRELIRIKSDLSITRFVKLEGEGEMEWTRSGLKNQNFYDYYPSGIVKPSIPPWFVDNPQGEIVIIPEYAYQTPELLSMLPASTVADEFARIEASLSNPQ